MKQKVCVTGIVSYVGTSPFSTTVFDNIVVVEQIPPPDIKQVFEIKNYNRGDLITPIHKYTGKQLSNRAQRRLAQRKGKKK